MGRALELRTNIKGYLVEIGGELRARGRNVKGKAWQIAVERPAVDGHKIQKIVPLDNISMATSGDYRNYFEEGGVRYSHLIDPRQLRPISHGLASVTVLHRDCMTADALATGLMVLGPVDGLQVAQEKRWPALFLVREGEKFREVSTSAFKSYIEGL